MIRIAVISSNIISVGYDPSALILEIEFKERRVYQYLGVPHDRYIHLMAADSKGKYHNQHIKHSYPYREVALFPGV